MLGIVVHGGAGGTSLRAERGVSQAAKAGMNLLREGKSSLDAVVAAVQDMENSGIFNAGVGSDLREDGITIEMDAVVATSEGLQGAVMAVRNVKNPVLLALAVAQKTPHIQLAGPGAEQFAREIGLPEHPGATNRAKRRFWKLTAPSGGKAISAPHDTVGAIALDSVGVIALAGSTGGSGLMHIGRVGDVPIPGAGFRIGDRGGVLATGKGEKIIRRQGSALVYQLLQEFTPQQACNKVVDSFPKDIQVGFIALTQKGGVGKAANCPMAVCSLVDKGR